jgi:deoxyxylulose-5-phosphate synthase
MHSVAKQRSFFGVVHWTANTSAGRSHRKLVGKIIETHYKGKLVREYMDHVYSCRVVREYNVPCDGLTQHSLTEILESVKDKKGRKAVVQVSAPGRGYSARAQGQTKKPGSHSHEKHK